MIVRPLSGRVDAVQDALLSHGWEGDLAQLTAGGLDVTAFHVTAINSDTIEAMLMLAPRLGLELVTGDDWILLAGGRARFGAFARPWLQPEATRELAYAVGLALPPERRAAWQHARGAIALEGPIIVGIVNLTPDSFSDGGSVITIDDVLAHVDRLRAGGAAIVDLGGESTRPGATPLTAAIEQSRLMPALSAVVARHPDLPLSVDTMHAATARIALGAGAAIINDVTAGRHDPALLHEVARSSAAVVLSHSRGPAGRLAAYDLAQYDDDVAGGVIAELQIALTAATEAGVASAQIAIDPGFGFAKTAAQNLTLLRQLDAVAALNQPLMVGMSRKRFLGEITGRDIADRDRATAAACAIAYDRGARLFRVHDPPRCGTHWRSRRRSQGIPLTNSVTVPPDARPPYRIALGVLLGVLAGYLVTLAPTVTFWDAGEFITAAHALGIPHPPGTPLYVLAAHVWGLIVPFGSYAWRINLFSAVCSAAASGLWFLVAHDTIARMHGDIDDASRRVLAPLGGIAAALLGAFTFSVWQNATEAEVYATSSLGMAMVGWCALRWRTTRETPRGVMLLLLMIYLCALMVADHMMGLLIGPPVVAFLFTEARVNPLMREESCRREEARIAVIGATWLLLVGVALANGGVVLAGAIAVAATAIFAERRHEGRFAAAATALLIVGVSATLFLLVRAQQHPLLDQGNPDSWRNLLAVVSRAQYPPRTPFDDPTVLHGPGNPGRTLTLLVYQIGNYAQYFDWQWARSLGDPSRPSIPRLAITLLMATLGIRGAFAQRRRDPGGFALVMGLFVVAGPALVLYLNFKPGPSIGWDRWLHLVDHEVRDRDYFFVASFVAWSIWVAIALTDLARDWIPRVSRPRRGLVLLVFAAALIPFLCNFRDASRRLTPEVDFAHDFGRALLESAPPNSILFTRGDNDTFPLWYLQQVEDLRPDVTVICLALTQANWYVKQLGRLPHIDATPAVLSPLWRGAVSQPVRWPLHSLTDAEIEAFVPFRATQQVRLDLGRYGTATIAAGDAVEPLEVTLFAILRMNAGRRPVAWALSADDALYGLGPGMIQEGMVYVMPVVPVDSAALVGGKAAGTNGIPLDFATTRTLVDQYWHFGALENGGVLRLDGNIQAVAATATRAITQVGIALAMHGDTTAAVGELRRAVRLSGDSLARAVLTEWHR